MARRLPPLNWLRTFETAARHLSFTLAAKELNVTQAAVSQQVKALEKRLGIPLFRRDHNRLFLTYAGQAWLPKLRAGFDLLASGTEELHIYDQGASLTVRLPSSFSIQWLRPPSGSLSCPLSDHRYPAARPRAGAGRGWHRRRPGHPQWHPRLAGT